MIEEGVFIVFVDVALVGDNNDDGFDAIDGDDDGSDDVGRVLLSLLA